MNQRTDQFRREIPSTGAAMQRRTGLLQTESNQLFDVKHQLSERPWVVLGAAVAAGYVLGSMGGEEEQRWHGTPATTGDYTQHVYASYRRSDTPSQAERSGGGLLSQLDDEMDMLKTAAVAALTTFVSDKIKEYVPALRQQLEQQIKGLSGKTPSTAQGASFSSASTSQPTNTEAIPTTTSYGSNMADRAAEHAKPYYPPGSTGTSGQRERGVGEDTTRS